MRASITGPLGRGKEMCPLKELGVARPAVKMVTAWRRGGVDGRRRFYDILPVSRPGRTRMNPADLEQNARKASALLKAMANERRLLILCYLAQGERSVGELESL